MSSSFEVCPECGALDYLPEEDYESGVCPTCRGPVNEETKMHIAHKLDGVKVTFENEEVGMVVNTYAHGGAPRIDFISPTDGPVATLTVNDDAVTLGKDEILVKGWSENQAVAAQFRNSAYFSDTGRRVKMGFCQAEVWKVMVVDA